MLSHINYPSPSAEIFLTGLGKARLVAKTDEPPPGTQALAARILAEDWLDRHIPTRDPDWLASRMWAQLCPKPQPLAEGNSGNASQAATPIASEASGLSAFRPAEAGDVDRAFLEWSAWCDVLGAASRWDPGWGPLRCSTAVRRLIEPWTGRPFGVHGTTMPRATQTC